MANLPILRTECDVEYKTPAGNTLNLSVNCAKSDSNTWPWKYFWTKTIGTEEPQLSNGTSRSAASISQEEDSSGGQVVMRTIFAYIATHPLSATINCSAKMQQTQGSTSVFSPNYRLIAKLYELNGSEAESYIDAREENKEATVTLPATVCPKVLWVGVAVQPSGAAPPLPSCSAKIFVTVS
jgi:hypothetical protein